MEDVSSNVTSTSAQSEQAMNRLNDSENSISEFFFIEDYRASKIRLIYLSS